MRVLCACEESQAVCLEFREKGHEAFSCDILPCSGGHPEWHIEDDVLAHLDDGWDLMIAFPPCTHICVSGARHFEQKRKDGRQQSGIDFFMEMINAPIEKIAVENPVGIMSNIYREPNQIVHPYYFGDPVSKATCLWLKNLPPLVHFEQDTFWEKQTWVEPEWHTCASGARHSAWDYKIASGPVELRGRLRSKTFPGIAKAMAEQWS